MWRSLFESNNINTEIIEQKVGNNLQKVKNNIKSTFLTSQKMNFKD